ncbi:hypothetical protein [Methanosarcina mazei]|uniref:Uncharacterized protein n=1 Tax=Methanosarcina mazei TaxID=2209 RepID=A0A0F8NDC7_METMZ|nr:hypothetical protein [Methanosarcina mazei]KKH15816.1 hypothetical protein DU48_11870 [Methanosarcina mazei]KKH17132.1 hypothetical protein DU65_12940 [Methanosarcina mazei]KKH17333.1 hypothetical protein DU44_12685 [Methanosarcina mazei]
MINLDKIKGKNIANASILLVTVIGILLLLTILGTFLLLVVLYLIPGMFEKDILKLYNYDTTLADIHISIANNLLMTSITFIYVLLTIALVTQSKEQVAQSKLEVAQTRKEQQIKDIENRLEKFYIPADEIINRRVHKKSHDETVHGYQGGRNDSGYVIGLKHLRKYSYLANKATYDAYEKYITFMCETRKTITCRDMYRDFKDYHCTDRKDNCIEKNWGNCPTNYDRCEYFDKCPTKDQNNIIINNTECEYYKILKDAITQDIKKYKEKLSELKG